MKFYVKVPERQMTPPKGVFNMKEVVLGAWDGRRRRRSYSDVEQLQVQGAGVGEGLHAWSGGSNLRRPKHVA